LKKYFILIPVIILLISVAFAGSTLTPILAEEGTFRFIYFKELIFNTPPVGKIIFPSQSWSFFEEMYPLFNSSTVDGDTVKAYINEKKVTIRLIGVDTPETVHPFKEIQFYGKEASSFTKNVTNMDKLMIITCDPINDKPDRYGRMLGYVWFYLVDSNGIKQWYLLNLVLIINGYGKPYMNYKFRDDYQSIFTLAGEYAKDEHIGLWSSN